MGWPSRGLRRPRSRAVHDGLRTGDVGSSALPVRPVLGRPSAACQVPRRVDKTHVRERLREVEGAMQTSGGRPSPVRAAEAAAESAVVVGR